MYFKMPCLVPYETECPECGMKYKTKVYCPWTRISEAFSPGRVMLSIGNSFECRSGVHCLFDVGPIKQGTCLSMGLYKENEKVIIEVFCLDTNEVYSFERLCPGERFQYKGVVRV